VDASITQWLQVVSNLGIPVSLLLWFILIERPRQIKREEEQQKRWEDNIKQALKEQRGDFEQSRVKDRDNSLEIAKLTSEIHAATSKEIAAAVRDNGEKLKALEAKLDRLLEGVKHN